MPNKFEWSEIAVIGLTAGLLGSSVALALFAGVNAGEMLGFFGGVLGSGLAVVGTLWIEERRRKQSRLDALNAIVLLASNAMRFKDAGPEDFPVLITNLKQSISAMRIGLGNASITDPIHLFGLSHAVYWIDKAATQCDLALAEHEAGNINDAMLAARTRAVVVRMVSPIGLFLRSPKLPKFPLSVFEIHCQQHGFVGEAAGIHRVEG